MARDVFTLCHYPIVLGIIFFAVAAKKTLEHPLDPLSKAGRWALGLGIALFFAGFVSSLPTIRSVAWERLGGRRTRSRLAVSLDCPTPS